MKQVLRTISFLGLFLFIEGFLLSVSARTETTNKEVLVLNSINFNLPWAKNFYWCIHDALQKQGISVKAESLSVPALVNKMEAVRLIFEEYKCSINLFVENGMDARLVISFAQESEGDKNGYQLQFVYEGDNGDCTEFMKAYQDWSLFKNPWPFSRIDTLSFAEYREKFQQDVDSVKSELKKVKSLAFRRIMAEKIDRSIPGNLFRFAWSKLRDDADFERYAESFDRNDPENMDITERYLRYYMLHHRASEGQGGTHYLNCLKQMFSNQEVINAFADDYINHYLKQAPEDMKTVLDAYKKVSTNTEAHAQADAVYAHYAKLRKGASAIDFEMTDAKGKKFRLSDFRGKAVYIDVWAT